MTDEVGDPPCWAGLTCSECGTVLDDHGHTCVAQPEPITRTIVAFHQDDAGEWVADLSCLHRQHVRHQPPFQMRPWVTTDQGRASHVGTEIGCALCARGELPDGLTVVRTAGPFDAATVPRGLLSDHVVADGRWALLRVLEGSVGFRLDTEPITEKMLGAGEAQAIPPGVTHALTIGGPVRLLIDFLTASAEARSRQA